MNVGSLKTFLTAAALLVWLVAPGAAFAEIDPEKKKDIEKMLEVSGTLEGLKQLRPMMLQGYMRIMKAAFQDKTVPDAFWDEFAETLITEDDLNSLIEEILPVYDNNFSHQEIKDLIQTFDSEAYRKWVKRLPAMMQESSTIGRQWGQRFGESGVVKERIRMLLIKYELDEGTLQEPGIQ